MPNKDGAPAPRLSAEELQAIEAEDLKRGDGPLTVPQLHRRVLLAEVYALRDELEDARWRLGERT